MIYVNKGVRLNEALALVEKAIRENPGFASFHDTRAAVLKAQGNMRDAKDEALRATYMEPENPEWWLTLLELQVISHDGKGKDTVIELDKRNASMNESQKRRLAELRLKT